MIPSIRATNQSAAAVLAAGLAIILSTSSWAGDLDHGHASFTAILSAHVTNGLVDYKALKASPQALNGYLDSLARVPEAEFRQWKEPQQIAFLANLYNAATLKLIVDNYPVISIKDIGGFFKGPWDQPVVRLFGQTITLNKLEHDILRKDYHEPRLHVALVCAAKGCPPLRSEAYVAERLSEQLDDQARAYLTRPSGFRMDRAKETVELSAIFKWYGKDFSSMSAFVSKYSGQKVDGLKIRYIDYDWSLNEQ